jgi:hypothetical protein
VPGTEATVKPRSRLTALWSLPTAHAELVLNESTRPVVGLVRLGMNTNKNPVINKPLEVCVSTTTSLPRAG